MSTETMRRWHLKHKNGFDGLEIQTVEKPRAGRGEILVKVYALSLNWRDGIIAHGTYPFPNVDDLVPGSDATGVVEAVGEGVSRWNVGDAVIANFTQQHIAGVCSAERYSGFS